MSSHTINQPDFPLQVFQVRFILKPQLIFCKFWPAGGSNSNDRDDAPLCLWKINAIVVKIVFEDDNPRRINPSNGTWA